MGAKYIYKVQAMDHACNFSKVTKTVPEVTAMVELPKKDVLVAWYDMENSLYDTTENQMDAVVSGTVSYDESAKKLGKQSLVLNGTNTLPASACHGCWYGGNDHCYLGQLEEYVF